MTMPQHSAALALIRRLSPPVPLCACFPGACRGGQVVNGLTPSGQRCRAVTPAKTGASS